VVFGSSALILKTFCELPLLKLRVSSDYCNSQISSLVYYPHVEERGTTDWSMIDQKISYMPTPTIEL